MIKLNRLLFILVFINVLIGNNLSASNTVRSASEYDYPPFAIVTDGQADGFSVDLLRASLNVVEMDVSYYVGPWSEIKMDLAEGRIDALPLVGRTPERELLYDFTVPYLTLYGAIFVKEGNSNITSIEDLTDKKIVVMKGDNAEEFIRSEHLSKHITTTTTFEEAFQLVSEGKQDAVVTQKLMGIQLLKNKGIEDVVPIAEIKAFKQDFTFAVKQGNNELLTLLNDGLSRIITDGTYNEIYAKWFGAITKEEKVEFDLTPEEQAWIDKHPEITLGGGISFEPFTMYNDDGNVIGYDADIIKLVSERTGLKINFELGKWAEIQERARKRELDGLSTASVTKERRKYYNPSLPLIHLTPLVIVKKGNPKNIHSLEDIVGKRVALQKGNALINILEEQTKEFEAVYFESTQDIIKAVVSEKADFAIFEESAFYIASQMGLGNMIEAPFTVGEEITFHVLIRKDWPLLQSIIDKGLKSINISEKFELRRKWLAAPQSKLDDDRIILTAQEQAWVKAHPEIRLGVDPAWQPTEFVDKKGQHQGISADYVRILNKRLGLNMKIVPNLNWVQVMDAVPKRGVDVLSGVAKTTEREKYLNYSEPYIYIDWVIISRTDTPKIGSLADLKGRLTAVEEDYSSQIRIEEQYPEIPLLLRPTTLDVLQSVIDGKSEAAVVELSAATLIMHGYRIHSLNIDQHTFQDRDPISFAVRKDWPELLQLLNKGLNSITSEEREMIENKWMAVPIQIGFTKKDMLRIVLYVIIAMGIFLALSLFWNRRLKKEIYKKNIAEEERKQTENEIELQNKELEKQFNKSEKQRIANLVILSDLNETTKTLKQEVVVRKRSELIQKTLFNISIAIQESEEINDLYQTIHKILGNILTIKNIFIAVNDRDSEVITFPYFVDEKDESLEIVLKENSYGLVNYVIGTGKNLLSSKQNTLQMAKEGKIKVHGTVAESWLGTPLFIDNEIYGVLAILSYNESVIYNENDAEIISFVSDKIADAIAHKQHNMQIQKDLMEKNVLLQELYHRTKNNMQVISSMLRIEERRSNSDVLKTSFKEITSKINTMALVHQKLYQAKDLSRINLNEYIRDLVPLVMRGFHLRAAKIVFQFEMEDIFVLFDTVMPLGLVLNEMITNVFKYAFPNDEKGEINIKMKLDSENLINIILSDNGVGIPENMDLRQSNSMGLQTMFSLIEHQLLGSVEYETGNGLTWYIKLSDSINTKRV